MNNENSLNMIAAVNTEDSTAVESTPVKTLKRQPGLGKLNRLIKTTQAALGANGHAVKRFKRDYPTGVATYVCPNCGATATATASPVRGASFAGGDALVLKCSTVNS